MRNYTSEHKLAGMSITAQPWGYSRVTVKNCRCWTLSGRWSGGRNGWLNPTQECQKVPIWPVWDLIVALLRCWFWESGWRIYTSGI